MKRSQDIFVASALTLFAGTALLKLATVATDQSLLGVRDVVFPFLRVRDSLLLACALEIVVCGFLLSRCSVRTKLMYVLWLSSAFMAYRGLVFLQGGWHYCKCLGNITDWLNLSPEAANRIALGILIYLLLGSGLFLAAGCARARCKRDLAGDSIMPDARLGAG